jgi:hypothetical protein
MKDINRGKQMKSVWEIRPPESWEKKFGKHPTQKPVALLERILLASSNEGDLVLDPFSGSGTTLLAAFRLRRHALGCEFSADFLTLSLRRLCSNLVQVQLSVSSLELSFSSFDFPVDPLADPMDRSCSGGSSAPRTVRLCSGGFTPPSSRPRAVADAVISSAARNLSSQARARAVIPTGASAPFADAQWRDLSSFDFPVDPLADLVDRSCSGGSSDPFCSGGFTPPSSRARAVIPTGASAPFADAQWRDLSFLRMSPELQLVQQELRFYFIGRADRRVIFSVQAASLDDARQKFRASGHTDSDALFIIKTETQIYLA